MTGFLILCIVVLSLTVLLDIAVQFSLSDVTDMSSATICQLLAKIPTIVVLSILLARQ